MPRPAPFRATLLRLLATLPLPLSLAAAEAPAPAAATAPLIDPEAGHQLFEVHCAPCHGPNGEGGRGPTLARPRLPRGTDPEAITAIIRSGIAGTEMPRFPLEKSQAAVVAAWVWHLGQLPPEKIPGDPVRGAALYRERGNCALCHQLHGYGGAIGPDLTDVGLRRSAAYLRTSVVNPGADVPKSFQVFRTDVNIHENFLMVTVMTKDGRQVTGVRVNEDTFTLQIRDFANQLHFFQKSDLANLEKDWGKSPMPSYAGAFSASELDDLIAFLSAQKG